MRRSLGRRLAIAAAWIPCAAAWAQPADAVQRLERQLRQIDEQFRREVPQDQPIAERLLLDYGGTLRFGFYSIDVLAGDTRFLRQYDLRLYLRAELDGAHRFFGRLRLLYDDWNSGDSLDGRGDELEDPIGERYWYEFDLRGLVRAQRGERLPWNLNVRAGKQFVNWGSGIVLSNPMYAGLVDVEAFDVGLTALVSTTPSSETVDFDGSRPGFDTDTSRSYYGGALEYRGLPGHRPYAYFVAQRDGNDQSFRVFPGPLGPIPTFYAYDSYYAGVGARGNAGPRLLYRAELIYEFGEGLSNSFDSVTGLAVGQTSEDISAWAAAGGLTWLLLDDRDSRFDFDVKAGSPDDDRLDSANTFGGNRSGTRDTAFNTLGFTDTGLVLVPNLSNLLMFRAGFSTYPFAAGKRLKRFRTGVAGYVFTKLDADAPMNFATVDETLIGGELDFFVDWRIASDVSANLRYGLFLPGEAMPPGQDDVRHFVYLGVNYAFSATAALLALILLAGCARTVLESSVVDAGPGELDFWDGVGRQRIVSSNDALHALFLLADGADAAADYDQRLAEAKRRGWLPEGAEPQADEAARVGHVAMAACRVLEIRGGLTMRLLGPSPRYCTRELVFLRILPPRTVNQSLSGLELIDLVGRVEDELALRAASAGPPVEE